MNINYLKIKKYTLLIFFMSCMNLIKKLINRFRELRETVEQAKCMLYFKPDEQPYAQLIFHLTQFSTNWTVDTIFKNVLEK